LSPEAEAARPKADRKDAKRGSMPKTPISSTDLTALFVERLMRFSECPDGILIAIVPGGAKGSGWSVVMNAGQRKRFPQCVGRIQIMEKQLRRIYVLAKD
jgi:hypothetical protein